MAENNKTGPRVLIIIPTLGERIDYLKETLRSVASQEVGLDIVIIFPLENIAVQKLAKQYNATCIDDPGGLSTAVNAGVASAKDYHEYIGWIGDDDLISRGSVEIAVRKLDLDKKAVLAYGYCDYINANGQKIFTSKAGKLAPWIMTWGPNLMPCPGTVFRRSALNLAGEFDIKNKYSMDLDMFLRLKKQGKFINTEVVMASFRWHHTSTTVSQRAKVLRETEMVRKRYLPKYLQPFSPVWDIPVRYATIIASWRVSKKALKLTMRSET